MSLSKSRILNRLKQRQQISINEKVETIPYHQCTDKEVLLEEFKLTCEENRISVHPCHETNWCNTLEKIVKDRSITTLLLGTGHPFQEEVVSTLTSQLNIQRFDQSYETMRHALFHESDAALVSAKAGIADTGTLLVVPDKNEPRTMSLIPPIHIALLHADDIYENLQQLIDNMPWAAGTDSQTPTNILFISSPSKTADIQQTLAYGAHGPKELHVLLIL